MSEQEKQILEEETTEATETAEEAVEAEKEVAEETKKKTKKKKESSKTAVYEEKIADRFINIRNAFPEFCDACFGGRTGRGICT